MVKNDGEEGKKEEDPASKVHYAGCSEFIRAFLSEHNDQPCQLFWLIYLRDVLSHLDAGHLCLFHLLDQSKITICSHSSSGDSDRLESTWTIHTVTPEEAGDCNEGPILA